MVTMIPSKCTEWSGLTGDRSAPQFGHDEVVSEAEDKLMKDLLDPANQR
jgi:hypothetical protein